MICLSSKAILVLTDDGSKVQFDSESLQTKLIKCCLMAGVKEFWIAEDLTNAVESALSFQAEKGVFFTNKEINLLISKMLEESGKHEIGAAFRTTIEDSVREISMSEENNIRKSIEKGLNIYNEELYRVSGNVHTACKNLQISNAPEGLLLELARFYRNQNKELPKIKNIVVKPSKDSQWLAAKQDILSRLSPNTKELIDLGLIDFSGIGTIFPSVKLEIRFSQLANYYQLEGIITELQLFPCFPIAVEALNEIISVIKENLPKLQGEIKLNDIPVYLKFSDIYFFAEKYFGVKLSVGEKFCKELAGSFAENLKYAVQVKIVRI